VIHEFPDLVFEEFALLVNIRRGSGQSEECESEDSADKSSAG